VGQPDAAVLRQASLGDVKIREHLETRDDGQGKVLGRWRQFGERAIDATADLEFVLERLEMNVGRLVADRLREHQVDEADDRCLPGELRDVRLAQVLPLASLRGSRLQIAKGGTERGVSLTVVSTDEQPHPFRVGDRHAHFAPEDERQVAHQFRIEWIDRRQQHRETAGRHGGNAIGACDTCVHQRKGVARQRGGQFRGVVKAQVLSHGAQQRRLVQQSTVNESPGEGLALGPALREDSLQQSRLEQVALGEKIVYGLVVSLEHEGVQSGPRPDKE